VVVLKDRATATSRRFDGDAESVLELVFRITEWLRLEDASLAIPSTAIRTDRGTETTGLTVKLCSLWATFDVARSWVGSGNNIVKGVPSVVTLSWSVLGCRKANRK
jgi:hypothetical protein